MENESSLECSSARVSPLKGILRGNYSKGKGNKVRSMTTIIKRKPRVTFADSMSNSVQFFDRKKEIIRNKDDDSPRISSCACMIF